MEPRTVLPAEIDAAAAEIVAAHARMLQLLRGRTEPFSSAELRELEELDESAESWLRTLRQAISRERLVARQTGGSCVRAG